MTENKGPKTRKCRNCGKMFVPKNPRWEFCIACFLAERDKQRLREGPTVRRETPSTIIPGMELDGREGHRRRGCYDDRLAEGFNMMGGDNA
jgi:hypothetical protein